MSVGSFFTPRRPLGRTRFVASQIGCGDVADRKVPRETCVATVRRALDAGINLVDTAPSYEDGYSEEIVGQALHGRREGVFVIDKIDHFDRPVGEQIDQSLRRLRLTHTDAFVFHGLSTVEAWQAATAPGGRFDELAAAVRAGKTRFRGISSHHPDVLRLAITSGLCDLVLFAVGPLVDERYIRDILPLAKQHNVGMVCFKTFAAGKMLGNLTYNQLLHERPRGKISSGGVSEPEPKVERLSVAECVHYTLTCDPDVALLGMSFPNEQDETFAAFKTFKPLSSVEMERIRRRAESVAADRGVRWWNPPETQ